MYNNDNDNSNDKVVMHFYFVSSHQAINESHIIKSLLRTTERNIVVLFSNRVISSRFFLFFLFVSRQQQQ